MTDGLPTAVGRTPEDRDSLLQAVALVEAQLADDVDAIAALTGHLTDYDRAGLVIAFLVLLEAADARDPGAVRSLLVDTRCANGGHVGRRE